MKPIIITALAVSVTALLLYRHRKKITQEVDKIADDLNNRSKAKNCDCDNQPQAIVGVISFDNNYQRKIFPDGLIQHHSIPTFLR